MRPITRTALRLAAAVSTAAALAAAAAGPASAKTYPPPAIHLLCAAAPVNGALHGSVCALSPGQTTAPNNYSATIAVSRVGTAGPNVTFAVTAGSLPPGLSHVRPVRVQHRHHRQPRPRPGRSTSPSRRPTAA